MAEASLGEKVIGVKSDSRIRNTLSRLNIFRKPHVNVITSEPPQDIIDAKFVVHKSSGPPSESELSEQAVVSDPKDQTTIVDEKREEGLREVRTQLHDLGEDALGSDMGIGIADQGVIPNEMQSGLGSSVDSGVESSPEGGQVREEDLRKLTDVQLLEKYDPKLKGSSENDLLRTILQERVDVGLLQREKAEVDIMPEGPEKDARKADLQRRGEKLIADALIRQRSNTYPGSDERKKIDLHLQSIVDNRLGGSVSQETGAVDERTEDVLSRELTRDEVRGAYLDVHREWSEDIISRLGASNFGEYNLSDSAKKAFLNRVLNGHKLKPDDYKRIDMLSDDLFRDVTSHLERASFVRNKKSLSVKRAFVLSDGRRIGFMQGAPIEDLLERVKGQWNSLADKKAGGIELSPEEVSREAYLERTYVALSRYSRDYLVRKPEADRVEALNMLADQYQDEWNSRFQSHHAEGNDKIRMRIITGREIFLPRDKKTAAMTPGGDGVHLPPDGEGSPDPDKPTSPIDGFTPFPDPSRPESPPIDPVETPPGDGEGDPPQPQGPETQTSPIDGFTPFPDPSRPESPPIDPVEESTVGDGQVREREINFGQFDDSSYGERGPGDENLKEIDLIRRRLAREGGEKNEEEKKKKGMLSRFRRRLLIGTAAAGMAVLPAEDVLAPGLDDVDTTRPETPAIVADGTPVSTSELGESPSPEITPNPTEVPSVEPEETPDTEESFDDKVEKVVDSGDFITINGNGDYISLEGNQQSIMEAQEFNDEVYTRPVELGGLILTNYTTYEKSWQAAKANGDVLPGEIPTSDQIVSWIESGDIQSIQEWADIQQPGDVYLIYDNNSSDGEDVNEYARAGRFAMRTIKSGKFDEFQRIIEDKKKQHREDYAQKVTRDAIARSDADKAA